MITKRLLPDFVVKNMSNGLYEGKIQAYAIFLDMSGFTKLTEKLMKQGPFGSERLSVILNQIFGALVYEIHKGGGFVPYFAGDALTGIFIESEVEETTFLQTLQSIYQLFENGMNFEESSITVKIGLSKGEIDWGIVGDEKLAFYFKGDAIDNSSTNQLVANAGEIVADLSFSDIFHYHHIPFFIDHKLCKLDRFSFETNLPVAQNEKSQPIRLDILEHFYTKEIIEMSNNGEFRSIVSVFISFENLDTYSEINQFVSVILHEVQNFSGYFKEIDFGDKGGVITVFFGIPITFENNTERALSFVGALNEHFATSNIKFRTAITEGVAFAGIIGGAERSQYAAIGSMVNLAARLMTFANWGEVLVDENISKEKNFKFAYKGKIRYKGLEGEVPTYQLLGSKNFQPIEFVGKMVARNKELTQLIDFAKPIINRNFAGIAAIAGEAGIGKSRLAYEVVSYFSSNHSIEIIHCQCDQILKKPFNPFIYYLKNFFHQINEESKTYNQQNFEYVFDNISKQLADIQETELLQEFNRLKPIYLAILGIFKENSLWEMLDAKGRYENTKFAIHVLLKSLSKLKSSIILIEDAHWSDESTLEVVHEFIQYCKDFPMFLLFTSRYMDNGNKLNIIEDEILLKNNIPTLDINLSSFESSDILHFAENKLKGVISEDIVEILEKSSNGNPFYVEQVLDYLLENNTLSKVNNTWVIQKSEVKLSNSINSILVARVDRLSALAKSTVKAAAVIGREFEVPILSEVMYNQSEFANHNNYHTILNEQIVIAEENQIWRAMNEMRYIFKHSLLREAVYDMQLRSRLKEIHFLIGVAIEKIYVDRIEDRYEDLAFHYEKAENTEKTIYYLRKSADKSRKKYQNLQAIEFYDKLIKYLDVENFVENKVNILLKKATLQEQIGQWDKSMHTCNMALLLAESNHLTLQIGRIKNTLGNLYLLKGNYDSAKIILESALDIFIQKDDFKGLAIVNGNLGNLYFRQGRYEEAKEYFIEAIQINKNYHFPTSAQLVANLGLTYMNQNQFDLGIKCLSDQLNLTDGTNDTRSLAVLHTNIGIVYFEKGDFEMALDHYQKGLEMSKMLGNQLLVSIALGCIGSVYERKGNYQKAMDLYFEDLEICQQLGDKQGISIALGLIGGLYSLQGAFDKAINYMNKNLDLCEKLNYRKGIAKALNVLGDIYFFLEKFDKSLEYYNLAIQKAKEIDNKILIIASLVEKGEVLIAKEDLNGVSEVIAVAEAYHDMNLNKALHLDIELLKAKLAVLKNDQTEAINLLNQLDQFATNDIEKAAIVYILWKLERKENHRQLALELYTNLYAYTPKYLYKLRLNKLTFNQP